MALRVLSWNLFHGRSVPGAGRSLLPEFAERLAGWEWDVACLQEVPPWWAPQLAFACGAEQRTALTSRNSLLPLRRFVAERFPDLIKSNGGGANAILVRGLGIEAHAKRRLRLWPERRVVHAVRLSDGVWVGNVHCQKEPHALSEADALEAQGALRRWSAGSPAALAGDFNVVHPPLAGFHLVASHHVDHVLARGLIAEGPGKPLKRGRLSDHSPIAVSLRVRGPVGSEASPSARRS
jgi:endonuclease/exonuclease/phosphatase family metal-dependent hydrolase